MQASLHNAYSELGTSIISSDPGLMKGHQHSRWIGEHIYSHGKENLLVAVQLSALELLTTSARSAFLVLNSKQWGRVWHGGLWASGSLELDSSVALAKNSLVHKKTEDCLLPAVHVQK